MTFKFKVHDHGTEHEQYFQGAGVDFTEFQFCVVGSGSSAREAGEDALEVFWENVIKTDISVIKTDISVADAEALEAAINALSEEADAHDHCEHSFSDGTDPEGGEDCEAHHYVSIRWRY